jgi:hypothetical protein
VNESVSLLHSTCVCVCVCVCVRARARALSLSREPAPKVSVVFDMKGKCAKSTLYATPKREGKDLPPKSFFSFKKLASHTHELLVSYPRPSLGIPLPPPPGVCEAFTSSSFSS